MFTTHFTLANDKSVTATKKHGRKPYKYAIVDVDRNEVISFHTCIFKAKDAMNMKCLARYACDTVLVKADA
jgi:hypothetical protein